MAFFRPYRNYRLLRRYQQIVLTVGRFGFGELVGRLKLLRYLKLRRSAIASETAVQSKAVRFRMMLEQLGPTFIKLGQLLATRGDILPPDMISELTDLQNQVTATPFPAMKNVLENHLVNSIEDTFTEFDTDPIASASIAQVYAARLKTGEKVAVKIVRPGTERIFADDLSILEHLAGIIRTRVEESGSWDVEGIVSQLRRSMDHELDLRHEGRNADIFRSHFSGDATVAVPKVYRELSGRNVLVMEFMEGRPINEFFGSNTDEGVGKELAHNSANAVLKQIYADGFFHADPHPHNMFVLDGNVICFLDFGMFGRLDDKLLSVFARALNAIVKKDADRLVKAACALEMVPDSVNRSELRLAVLDVMEQYHGLALKEISVSQLLHDIVSLISCYRLRMRPEFLFLIKALGTIENTVRQLDPEFNLIGHTEPFVRSLLLKQYHPGRFLSESQSFAEDIAQLTRESPEHLLTIMRMLRDGKARLAFHHKGLERPIAQLNQMTDKIVLGLIIAALIIASAVMAQSGIGPKVLGYPLIGGVGFVLAGIAGLVIIVDILRSLKK